MRTFKEIIDGDIELKIQGKCVAKRNQACLGRADTDIEVIACIGKHGDIYTDKYWIKRNRKLYKSVAKFLRAHANYIGTPFDAPNFLN